MNAEPWENDQDYDVWIIELRESVVEGEYGYEPGEFAVYPAAWWHLYKEGLTPVEAFERALNAFDAERSAAK